MTLNEEEKREMLLDARDPTRASAFAAAQRASHARTLDDYIEFLSENMSMAAASAPRITVTDGFRL